MPPRIIQSRESRIVAIQRVLRRNPTGIGIIHLAEAVGSPRTSIQAILGEETGLFFHTGYGRQTRWFLKPPPDG